MRRRYWIMSSVIAVAVVVAGSALAATKLESPSTRSQAIIDDAAGRLHVTPQALSSALEKALDDQVDAAVVAGHLTKQQGDELKARIAKDGAPALGEFSWGSAPAGRGFGFGQGEIFGRGPIGGIVAAGSKAVRAYLGVTQTQLHSALASGKSLAQLAKAHGKTTDGLVAGIVAAAKTRLDEAVAAKHLTSAQEQAMLSRLKTLVESLVTRSPQKMLGHGLGFGPGSWHRFWGPPGVLHRSLRPPARAPAPQL